MLYFMTVLFYHLFILFISIIYKYKINVFINRYDGINRQIDRTLKK